MNAEQELNREMDIDLAGLLATLRAKIGKLLMVSSVLTAVIFLALQFISPKYKSETRILIESREAILSRARVGNSEQQRAILDQEGIASQVQIIMSRDVARKVVENLKLSGLSEFDSAMTPSFMTDVLVRLGLVNDPTQITQQERVIKSFMEKLKVFQVQRTRVIVIEFSSKSQELAGKIPNEVANVYLKLQENAKRGIDPAEVSKLEPELNKLRDLVREAEAKVAEFRSTSDLLVGRDNRSLATQQLSDLSTELSRVRSERSSSVSRSRAIRDVLRAGGAVDSLSNVLDSNLIQRLRERQIGLRSQIADLSTTLLPGHPRIQSLNSQLNNLNGQIRAEARKVLASLVSDAKIAKAQENDLIASLNALKAESSRVGEAQVELRALEREANAQRELLNTYLLRYREATSQQAHNLLPADARIISMASRPSEHYFPKKLPILVATFFGSLLVGCMIVLSGSLMGGRATNATVRQSAAVHPDFVEQEESDFVVQYEDEIATESQFETADSAIPEESISPSLETPVASAIMNETQDSEALSSSQYDAPEGAVEAAEHIFNMGVARIVLLSPEGRAGSEATVLLSRYLASRGASVVVVDMTGQGASSQTMLRSQSSLGIKDLLAGRANFSDVIHSDSGSHAHIIPGGTSSTEAAAAAHDRLPLIIDALEDTYDFVLVDCGAADISGISKISSSGTVHVINTVDDVYPARQLAGIMQASAQFDSTISLYPTVEERQMMGTYEAA